VAEALRAERVRRVYVAAGARGGESLKEISEEASRQRISLEIVDRDALNHAGLQGHQGVAASLSLPREVDERGLVAMPFTPDSVVVVLDGITDPQNLGACARSAEAAGASVVVARRRRAAPLSPAAISASAGALFHIPMARVPNLPRVIERLKDRGFFVAGLDHRAEVDIHSADPPEGPVALVVGSEGAGLSRLVRESCDFLVSIPLKGKTESLNAAAALAVGLFGYALRPPGAGPPPSA
jgi:23S rRNA (guanosine2251-2'-O)-methyltransferase